MIQIVVMYLNVYELSHFIHIIYPLCCRASPGVSGAAVTPSGSSVSMATSVQQLQAARAAALSSVSSLAHTMGNYWGRHSQLVEIYPILFLFSALPGTTNISKSRCCKSHTSFYPLLLVSHLVKSVIFTNH